jgi:peptidoglycan hydrolase-like protein with peptidoglycan-binding domain
MMNAKLPYVIGMSFLLVISVLPATVLSGPQAAQSGAQGNPPQAVQADAPIYISPASLRLIQQKLSEQGVTAGKADGIWGRATAEAVQRFQLTRGLEPTGTLTIETIQVLGLPQILTGSAEQPSSSRSNESPSYQGVPLYISPGQLREVQRKLGEEGFEVVADGLWGRATRKALQVYQSSQGWRPTGCIDLITVQRLGLDRVTTALSGQGQTGIAAIQPVRQQASQTRQRPLNRSGREEAQGYFGNSDGMGTGSRMPVNAIGPAHKPFQGQGAPLYAGPDTVSRVQHALRQSGHDPGDGDGLWNASTQAAVRDYQKAQGLEPTGALTIDTVRRLTGGFHFDTIPATERRDDDY